MMSAGEKPPYYYQGNRSELIAHMPANPGRVLEIGCAAGGFGRLLKERGATEVWGIEIVPSAAEIARSVLDHVLVGDAVDLVDQLPLAYFDLVVCNDVLEHMYDPWKVLEKLKAHISPDGVLISSIPNIRYYPTLWQLVVHKKWEYEEQGILDSTHVRFFTVRSIHEMYQRLGYRILRHDGIDPMPERPLIWRLGNLLVRGRATDMKFAHFLTVVRPLAPDAAPLQPSPAAAGPNAG